MSHKDLASLLKQTAKNYTMTPGFELLVETLQTAEQAVTQTPDPEDLQVLVEFLSRQWLPPAVVEARRRVETCLS